MNLKFDVLIRDNADFNIGSLCKQKDTHPTLKGRVGGEDGFDVTIYLNKVMEKGIVLVASEDSFEEFKVSDLNYGNVFGSSEDYNVFCIKTRIRFKESDQIFEIFLDRTELETVFKVQKFLVPVVYQVWGEVEIEATSVEEARKKLADPKFVDEMGLPEESHYLDDSYMIDEEGELKNVETGETFPVSEE
jgi:hypothetical protein